MKRLLISLLAAALLLIPAEAMGKKIKLKVKPDKTAEASATPVMQLPIDSVAGIDLLIRGYDKPLNSEHETFFVTNQGTQHISGFTAEITYTTTEGEQLHKRIVEVVMDVPAGETRQAEVKSFDRNRSFYYHLGQKPRRSAVPFLVEIKPLTVLLQQVAAPEAQE